MIQFRKKLARQIKRRRGDSSQRKFAKTLGISQGTVQKIEIGQQNVTIDTLEKLCRRLKCNLSDLVPDED